MASDTSMTNIMNEIKALANTLDRNEQRPLWRQIGNELKGLVRKLPPGTKLPSEREMMHLLGVHRGTVQRAIELLAATGLVERDPPRGTFTSTLASAGPIALLQFQVASEHDRVYVTHIGGIQQGLSGTGRSLIPLLMMVNRPPTGTLIRSLRSVNVEGIILDRFSVPDDVPLILDLKSEFPMVVMGKEFEEAPIPCAQAELVRSTGALTRYLADKNCRTLIGIGWDRNHTGLRKRCLAFVAAAATLGLAEPHLLWDTDLTEWMDALLARESGPFGVFSPLYGPAESVRDLAARKGLALGKDIFICTCPPPQYDADLSGMALAVRDEVGTGREAAKLLLRHAAGKAHPRELVEVACRIQLPDSTSGIPAPERVESGTR